MKKLISLLIIISLMIPAAYAHGNGDDDNMNMGNTVVWVPVMAGVIFLSYLVFRHKDHGKTEAVEILDKKYANGEIEREEYLKRKEDLKKIGGYKR